MPQCIKFWGFFRHDSDELRTQKISQCRKVSGMLTGTDLGVLRAFSTTSVDGTRRYPWKKWLASAAVLAGGAALLYTSAYLLHAEGAPPSKNQAR